eukprot:79726_1
MGIYSLWLRPPEPMRSILERIIYEISEKYDSKYRFVPHVTLLSRSDIETHSLLEIDRTVSHLCKQMNSIRVVLNEVGFDPNGTHYKAAHLCGSNLVNSAFIQAKIKSLKAFGAHSDAVSGSTLAHLSLLYFDISTRSKSSDLQQATMEIKQKLKEYKLFQTGSEYLEFSVNETELWYTPPNVNEWFRKLGVTLTLFVILMYIAWMGLVFFELCPHRMHAYSDDMGPTDNREIDSDVVPQEDGY